MTVLHYVTLVLVPLTYVCFFTAMRSDPGFIELSRRGDLQLDNLDPSQAIHVIQEEKYVQYREEIPFANARGDPAKTKTPKTCLNVAWLVTAVQ